MGSVPAGARVYVACVVLAALACLAPVPDLRVPWWIVALLAVLYAGCDHIPPPRGPRAAGSPGGETPQGMGTFLPVLLAGAFLLPPSAAALVALPGALLARVDQRPRTPRRVWRAAQLAVAVWAASRAYDALGGPDAVATPVSPTRWSPRAPPSSPSAPCSPFSTAASSRSPNGRRCAPPGAASSRARWPPSPRTDWPD